MRFQKKRSSGYVTDLSFYPSIVAHAYILSTKETEVGYLPQVLSYSWLHSEFKVNLKYKARQKKNIKLLRSEITIILKPT